MKKFIPVLSIAMFMVACNSNPQANLTAGSAVTQPASQIDTTGLAKFQQWKAQNELSDVQELNQAQSVVYQAPAKKASQPRKQTSRPSTPAKSSGSSNSSAGSGSDVASGGSGSSESSGEAKASQKKGISKAAKGAVIGGVAGAAGGAILNKKNRVLGAVIGGVVGAAGGYGIGRQMDKKDGRIEYTAGLK
jgi:hypothetical protein